MPHDGTILVTNVSYPLGQGVLRLLARQRRPLRRIGVARDRVSAGNHLCDHVYHVPWLDDRPAPDYLNEIERICSREEVGLIVPCTDPDTVELTAGAHRLPAIACSSHETSRIAFDKYLSWTALSTAGVPFAETVLPSEFEGQFQRYIVKPRTGGLSIGIHVDPPDPTGFADDHVVQRFYVGTEITTAFYVDRFGTLLGHISMERELRHGITFKCMVTNAHDEAVDRLLRRLVNTLCFRGPCNIQSIVTAQGEVVPFEINARISGSASIRAHFGFDDLEYLIDEYIYGRGPSTPTVRPGSAVRMLTDVIYPGVNLDDIGAGTAREPYRF